MMGEMLPPSFLSSHFVVLSPSAASSVLLYFRFQDTNMYKLLLHFPLQINPNTSNSKSLLQKMDLNASSFLLNPSTLHSSGFYQSGEDDSIIDLGLSLRTFQPDAYHPSHHLVNLEEYGDLMGWPQESQTTKHSTEEYQRMAGQDCDEEAEGVQSKERWAYIKVNMDGVIVGRKICLIDLGGYSSLAHQLEDMFGRQSSSGLRLFQAESEFCLFYKDREENWRTVGDVPWREFIENVKRLRIVGRNEPLLPY